MYRFTTFVQYFLYVMPYLFFGQGENAILDLNLPNITHFTEADFKADSQFWTMCRDNHGIYYFGNNDGALVYDGELWKKVLLPNSSSVRSLIHTSTGKIYVGGYNELGLIEKDSTGTYSYRSSIDELGLGNRNLENLWQVDELDGVIIYRTFDGLVVINNATVTYIPATELFSKSGIVNAIYYVQDSKSGIMAFNPKTGQLSKVFAPDSYDNAEMIALLPSEVDDTIELVSKSGTIYRGNITTNTVDKWVDVFSEKKEDFITVTKKRDTYLFGTLNSKIISLSKEGKINNVPPVFDKIQDATVLGFFEDEDNLWVLMNNGLDFIEYNPIVSQLFDKASVYDILIKNNLIYLATNKGIYYANGNPNIKDELEFKRMDGSEGQTWSFIGIDDVVLVGHDKGLFVIKDSELQRIGTINGIWKIMPIPNKQNRFLACSYNGLYLVERDGESFTVIRKIDGFDESTRDIIPADQENTFWVCHGYKGVFKIRIDEDYNRVYASDHYTDQNGFKSYYNIDVYQWNSETVFTTNTGIYEFDYERNSFVPFTPLNIILDTLVNTRKIIQEKDITWVVQDDEVGYFNASLQRPVVVRDVFLNLKGNLNRGMESILPLKNNNVLIGAKTGMYLYNLAQPSKTSSPILFTRIIRYDNQDEKALPIAKTKEKIVLPTKTDILRFEYASPKLNVTGTVQYSYILEDIDQNWSSWDDKPYKEYTHLRPGDYIFKVKSRNLNGDIGDETSYSFEIVPQWYQTKLARFAYVCFCLFLIGLGYWGIRRKIAFENRKSKIAADKSKRLLELEIKQLKLTQDKTILEEDMILKSKELANYTMQLVNKKHAFVEIQDDLKELKGLIKNRSPKQKLLEIFKKLHLHKIGDEYMEVFDVNFEKVHHNFFEKLLVLNFDLTKRELRLCAFIKMELTNKEISPLLNISVRGVETARYRVRKKLDIEHEYNFHEFLVNL